MRRLVTAVVWTASLPVASAQVAPPKPEFGSYADRVLVDVVVTDKKHRPVLDLTAADFEVFEDGKRREVVSFAAFGAAAARALASRPSSAPQPAAAADPEPPRFVRAATVLLIDEGHLSLGETARLGPVLTKVLHGLAYRAGQVLVLAPHSGVAFAGSLPQDLAQMAQAAGRIRGRRTPTISTFPMTDAEALEIEAGNTLTHGRVLLRFQSLNPGTGAMMESMVRMRAAELAAEVTTRRRDTFSALDTGLDWLSRQPGRHSVLMVSPGFPNDPMAPEFRELTTRSLRVNAPVHFVDVGAGPSPLGTFESIEYPQALPAAARVPAFETTAAAAGADRVASSTGGLRVGGSDIEAGFERVLDTTRTYYVLGYDPPRDGKSGFRKIQVEVKRKGLRVLARKGYFDDGNVIAAR